MLVLDVGELLADEAVVGRPVDVAEDADGGVLQGPRVRQARQGEGEAGVLGVRVVADDGVLADLGDVGPGDVPVGVRMTAFSMSLPNRMGWPCSRRIMTSSRVSESFMGSHAPSLKMLQFW